MQKANACVDIVIIFGPSFGIFAFYLAVIKGVKESIIDYDLQKHIARMCLTLNAIFLASMLPYGVTILYTLITGEFMNKCSYYNSAGLVYPTWTT